MEIIKEININSSFSKLWDIIVMDFTKCDTWTTLAVKSIQNPEVKENEGRICFGHGNSQVIENSTKIDKENKIFKYSVRVPSMSFILKDGSNTWRFNANNDGSTQVKVHIEVKSFKFIEILLERLLKRKVSKVFDTLLEELKYYSENDVEHPGKSKQIRYYGKRV